MISTPSFFLINSNENNNKTATRRVRINRFPSGAMLQVAYLSLVSWLDSRQENQDRAARQQTFNAPLPKKNKKKRESKKATASSKDDAQGEDFKGFG